jgi:hypothetical protein
MQMSDLLQPDAYRDLPLVPSAALRWLWFSDYWDGPRSGLILYQETTYWVEVCGESDPGTPWYRHFVIIALSADQLREEEHWHALFEQKVGTHTTLDSPARPLTEHLKPRDQWDDFYGPYQARTPPNFANNAVIGWFEA